MHRNGATCSVDNILDMYYYGVFKIDARLYNSDNVFLNQVNATCSFLETNNYISCDLREEPWDWLVQNLPHAFAP